MHAVAGRVGSPTGAPTKPDQPDAPALPQGILDPADVYGVRGEDARYSRSGAAQGLWTPGAPDEYLAPRTKHVCTGCAAAMVGWKFYPRRAPPKTLEVVRGTDPRFRGAQDALGRFLFGFLRLQGHLMHPVPTPRL